jgi:hypothetical protein
MAAWINGGFRDHPKLIHYWTLGNVDISQEKAIFSDTG